MNPSKILAFVCALAAVPIHAEVFIGPSSPTNRLMVGENEAIMLQAQIFASSEWSVTSSSLVVSNVSYTFKNLPGTFPTAIPGPAEVVLTNIGMLTFTRLVNVDMGILLFDADVTNFVINVPQGKRLQIFTLNDYRNVTARVNMAGTWVESNLTQKIQYEGPMQVDIVKPYSEALPSHCILGAYWIVDSTYANPGDVAMPENSVGIVVEKSKDLSNWVTQAVMSSPAETKAFYRLRPRSAGR